MRSAPDHRTRRALLHLSYSCAPQTIRAALVTHDPGGRQTAVFTRKLRLENWQPFATEGVLSEVADMYPARYAAPCARKYGATSPTRADQSRWRPSTGLPVGGARGVMSEQRAPRPAVLTEPHVAPRRLARSESQPHERSPGRDCLQRGRNDAKRFLTGAAVASLMMIAGTVMMVLVRAV